MRIDHDLIFSDGQADVRNAGTYTSDNKYDLGKAKGVQGNKLGFLVIRVGTAFAGGTSVEFKLVCADDEAISTNVTSLISSGALAEAALTKDTIVAVLPMPRDIPREYLAVQATGVGTHSAGTFDAFIVDEAPIGAY